MAVRKNENPIVNDDVQIIRQILIGEHLDALGEQLSGLEASIEKVRIALDHESQLRLAESSANSEHLGQFHEELKAEFEGLRKKLLDEVDKMAVKQQKSIDSLNRKVDRIMRQVQKEMSGHESQLENLVGSLASALTAYRRTGDEESE
jgi:predicted  nucleic acid-binding Zn-ribbon protein